jgi:crossover junction endodeoxyribonuclease RusA
VTAPDWRLSSLPLLIVYGTPAPQGSKRALGPGRMIESSKKVKPWRHAVLAVALKTTSQWRAHPDARPGEYWYWPIEGPVSVEITFTFNKQKQAPKNVRTWPITRHFGDLDKLVRSTLDALTDAHIWNDDSQVVDLSATKHFTDHPYPHVLSEPGAVIRIRPIP